MGRLIKDVIRGRTPVMLPSDTTIRAAATLMKGRSIGSVLVVDDGKLVGIFTERDALFKVLAQSIDPDSTPISAVMTTKLTTVTADGTLLHALHLMHDCGFRHVPVVNGEAPVGIVSIRDALGNELVKFEQELGVKQAIAELV